VEAGTSVRGNNGAQVDLIVDAIDRDNQFVETRMHIEPSEVCEVLPAIDEVGRSLKNACAIARKKNLFK
jgi:hypothetical protein